MRLPGSRQWDAISLGRLRQLLAEYGDDIYLAPIDTARLRVLSNAGLPPDCWLVVATVDLRTEEIDQTPPAAVAAARAVLAHPQGEAW